MYNEVKSIKKRQFHTNQAGIGDNNSTILSDTEQVLGRWLDHGAKFFVKPGTEILLSTRSPDDQEASPLLFEVEQAVA